MQDMSDDDEFYDAVGSVGQIEEIKAELERTRSNNNNHVKEKRPTVSDSSVRTQPGSQPNFQTSSNIGKKKSFPEENENTLTMSEREVRELRETQDKNLQQILDKLDENSAYISAELPGMKSKDGSQDKAEDSPSRAKIKKSEDNSDQSKSLSPRSSRSKNSINNSPNKFTRSNTGSKRSFFSFVNRKRSNDPEFTKESVKLHNKHSSNFEKLLCLQTIEDEKKLNQQQQQQQDSTPTSSSSKKTKNNTAIWIAKFSPNNRYLATGGSDGLLRVYPVTLMEEGEIDQDSLDTNLQVLDSNYISLIGHKHDIIDISWFKTSKYIITSAIDKMVILWNVEEKCLMKIFEHSDIVSCLSFHPFVDEFFATGCFDKMIRIWDINETKVVDWVQTGDLITAMTFSPDKNHLLVGFYKGTVKIYRTDQGKLKFTMEIVCKNSFAWGKLNKVGKKVTGIIFTEDYEFLVMTNDSRMRLVDMNTYETKMKYKGHTSGKYHIQPSYNYEKELILSGSEDEKVYVWNKISDYVPQLNPIYSFQKANRNTSYEVFKPFPKSNTTCAIWVPFSAVQKYREKVLSVWKDIYVDNLMILFSSDNRIKVVGNMIELDAIQEKKPK